MDYVFKRIERALSESKDVKLGIVAPLSEDQATKTPHFGAWHVIVEGEQQRSLRVYRQRRRTPPAFCVVPLTAYERFEGHGSVYGSEDPPRDPEYATHGIEVVGKGDITIITPGLPDKKFKDVAVAGSRSVERTTLGSDFHKVLKKGVFVEDGRVYIDLEDAERPATQEESQTLARLMKLERPVRLGFYGLVEKKDKRD